MLLFDRENWPLHKGWAIFAGILAIIATAWFFFASWGKPFPGGGSLPGMTFGLAGGGIILFEFLLWPRKILRTLRVGRAQVWMRAHIWLGLLCLPILIYHSGLRLGGSLAAALMILLIIVVASGIWGLCLQMILPRRILTEAPAETIYSQIPSVIDNLLRESARLVAATCGPEEAEAAPLGSGPDEAFLTVGTMRTAGSVQGRVLETRALTAAVPNSELLRQFFRQHVVPFMRAQRSAPSTLATPARAAALFRELRTKLDPATYPTIDQLEDACAQRRELDTQKRLTFWLHSWLWIHLPLSIALVVLMLVHAWVAMRYWW